MRIEIDVSDENEGTDSPYWLILDPSQNLKRDLCALACQITGPYFSRQAAEKHLHARRYNYSDRAMVYCLSGYWSSEYKLAIREKIK